MTPRAIAIGAGEAGQRLDRFLRKLLPEVPLGALMKHLRQGGIRVDGGKADGDLRLLAGMTVELRLPASDLAALDARAAAVAAPPKQARRGRPPAAGTPRIVFADLQVLVVDKPAGLAVHGGTGQEHSVVHWLTDEYAARRTATFSPAPAHRLDRDTSGLVAIGLDAPSLAALTAAFREDRVQKVYVAVADGIGLPERGTIELPLLDVPAATGRQPKVVVDKAGKPARTDFEVIGRGPRRTLLRLRLFTGRTHQIRVHLAHSGFPVVGDRRYGRSSAGDRLYLHATELVFPHPTTREPVQCKSPVPPAFAAALRA